MQTPLHTYSDEIAPRRARWAGRRRIVLLAASIAAIAVAGSMLSAAAPSSSIDGENAAGAPQPALDEPGAKTLVREGTRLVNRAGYFRQRGDGATFHSSDGALRIESLENLNLERIVRTIGSSEKPDELVWNVTGVVTEFQSGNYLFVDRAILATKSGSNDDSH